MKVKVIVLIVLILILFQTLFFGYILKQNINLITAETNTAAENVDRLEAEKDALLMKLDNLKKIYLSIPCNYFIKDPEKELVTFLDYLDSPYLADVNAKCNLKFISQYLEKPFPHHENSFDITFDFDNTYEAENLINYIFMQNKFLLKVNNFSANRTHAGKTTVHLSFSLMLLLKSQSLVACKPKSFVVLLESPNGTTGLITVSNASGTRELNKKGFGISLDATDDPPPEPFKVSKKEIEEIFKKAIEAKPEPPVNFTIYFETAKAVLTDKSQQEIPGIVSTIQKRASSKIGISGHSDRAGNKNYNYKLSVKRAEAVKKILLESGAKPHDITEVTSHGENNPIIPTKDGVSEPRNRRVEVFVR